MAAADVEKIAIFDQRIVQHPAKYAVEKGSLSLTNAPFRAISQTSSQHTFNINVPSQNVFVDRAMDWASEVAMSMVVTVAAAGGTGNPIAQLGLDWALCAFPLNEMLSTLSATINDTSVIINSDTVLHEVLRMVDYRKNRLARTCPTMLDRYKNYADAYASIASPLAGYSEQSPRDEQPNGAFWNIVFTDPAGNPLTGTASPAYSGAAYDKVNGVPTVPSGATAGTAYTLYFKFVSVEKFVLPPFIFADSAEWDTGLFGINNIQFVCNLKSNAGISRVVRSAETGRAITAVQFNPVFSGSPFNNSTINVQFLTPSLDLPLPAKSCVPYFEFPRFLSTNLPALPAGVQTTVQSQTIVLNMIPDYLICYAKPNQYGVGEGDWYIPLVKMSLNFDNFAGLLSAHQTHQLYQMAVHNGLDMDYNEWSGLAHQRYGAGATGVPAPNGRVQTVGGFMILRPGVDFALQAGQAAGTMGNYVLQYNPTLFNPSGSDIAAGSYTLYTIAVNSGFFESMAGSSRILKGILSEADVISAEPAGVVDSESAHRMIGHGFFSKLGSMLSKGVEIYKKTKPIVSAAKGLLPEGKVKDVLGAVGYGAAGAGMSGAGSKKSLSARLM
jgi:hypothetical protein